ncbi:hypothetical protein PR048_021759 [Dryococelus australis]|uniref:Uncharacterized protein n=1 Tax=Dryococelus australis TaxID=614101 RepID=A0ABQ9GZ41_9NEOP|nr:hypothetical protein PR048_021759 [Dryococelus australis]
MSIGEGSGGEGVSRLLETNRGKQYGGRGSNKMASGRLRLRLPNPLSQTSSNSTTNLIIGTKRNVQNASISMNTCINPPLRRQPGALMNLGKHPDCSATRHNTATEGAHIVHWCCLHNSLHLANRIRFTAGSAPNFRAWESCRTMPLVSGFSRDLPFPPPLHYGAAPYSSHFTLIGSLEVDPLRPAAVQPLQLKVLAAKRITSCLLITSAPRSIVRDARIMEFPTVRECRSSWTFETNKLFFMMAVAPSCSYIVAGVKQRLANGEVLYRIELINVPPGVMPEGLSGDGLQTNLRLETRKLRGFNQQQAILHNPLCTRSSVSSSLAVLLQFNPRPGSTGFGSLLVESRSGACLNNYGPVEAQSHMYKLMQFNLSLDESEEISGSLLMT